ncbi:PREDICTED: heparin sulfate O-sulfotransferase-like [Ceratosolen solmsi marchali]|uniref:Heparin sulfate O-sulfotransferase-like n=1 Tax=Ceratosolen solmsi marchali TaxID=326594 RepID=A0AAJ6YY05_9HYME|nr:PREDICTED: heparin sulfate O-sulfotransferase-like [Ceratosolen solmsi marchali]
MLVRTFSYQWILIFVLIVIIFYENTRLNYLEDSSKKLRDTLLKVKTETKSDPLPRHQLRMQSNNDNYVVIYNRVPKTGSTSFVGVVYDLCKKNKYHTLHINITNNMHTLTLPNQIQFIRNISQWDSIKPAFYHGHMAFLDFKKFGLDISPLYINLLRKPLDRFISYYYFLRYGDNFRPHLIRRKHGDTKTFDECINAEQADCDPNNMWLQIPFLCGHDPACWEVGNEWALEEAKRNLQQHYLLVGVTEELSDFILTLQNILPRFFKGAHNIFIHNNKSHLRQTTQKIDPLPETIKKIQKTVVWKMENNLYNYALSQFHAVKKRLINASTQDASQRFFYEKIRPK